MGVDKVITQWNYDKTESRFMTRSDIFSLDFYGVLEQALLIGIVELCPSSDCLFCRLVELL